MSKILVVEDDLTLSAGLCFSLDEAGHLTAAAYTCQKARQLLKTDRFDLVILDVNLPDGNGFDICRECKSSAPKLPVIFLTANDLEQDQLNGFDLGADDYITKPFRPLELIARVKAQLRRFTKYNNLPAQEEDPDTIAISGLTINKRDHTCTLNEKPLALTPTEFSILWSLCKNRGEVVSSDRLFFDVWGEKYYSSNNNTIMVHIRHLREKMNDSSEKPKYIKTVWGVGYKIE